ncbi:gas vesicle protein [Actinomadura vinacea]|uniref:gas vesicle protein n=1 Tax=Actinomadura vinacea TaxID=115336 RepID=UPI003CD09926
MTDPMEVRPTGARSPTPARSHEPANLADILERVLDKGIVIAGDIQVNLLDIELLTIKLRLIVASVDRAKEMGIDWWEHDPTLSSRSSELAEENRQLRRQVSALEAGDERVPTARAAREDQEEPVRGRRGD